MTEPMEVINLAAIPGAEPFYVKASCTACWAGPFIVRYSTGQSVTDLPCPANCGRPAAGMRARDSKPATHQEIKPAMKAYTRGRGATTTVRVADEAAPMRAEEADVLAAVVPDRRYGLFVRYSVALTDCMIGASKSADVTSNPVWVHQHLPGEDCTEACTLVLPDERREAALHA